MRWSQFAVVALVGGLTGFAVQAEDFPPKAVGGKAAAAAAPTGSAPVDVADKPAARSEGSKGITVVAPWSRATPGAAKNGAVFLEIRAGADFADKLLSASGAVAENVEIHNHINDNGIMQMRRVDAIEIGEGSSTKLVPGGYHIMLLGLKQPLKAGETFKLKLTFEKTGAIEVDVAVRANNAAAAGKGSGSGAH
jgi:periplasmic copper chaperone A